MKKYLILIFIFILLSTIISTGCFEQTPTNIILGNTYSGFGFSFKYSNNMIIEEQGFANISADYTSGILFGDVEYADTETYHIIKISWFDVGPIENSTELREKNLLESLDAGFLLIENDEIDIIKKEIKEDFIESYLLYYQSYEYHVNDLILYGVLGAFYCDENNRYYTINIGYSEENVLSIFQKYINSFDPYC